MTLQELWKRDSDTLMRIMDALIAAGWLVDRVGRWTSEESYVETLDEAVLVEIKLAQRWRRGE